jgi:streptogramin lyase
MPLFSQTYNFDALLNGTTQTTCSGTFYDSGGSGGSYQNDQDYTVTFCTSNGTYPRLTFTNFVLESGYDYLEIYDGNSTASPLIGTFSASSPGTITASGSCLTVHFVSDFSVTASGWAATVSCNGTGGSRQTCSDFAVLAVNYNNSTLTRYDNETGGFLNTVATSTQGLSAPNFMYQLPNGELLVPNGSANNIVKLDPYTGVSLGVFATGLNFPEQIKLGPDGNLYLANQNANNIKKYTYSGTLLATFANANISVPQGIGFDGSGNLLVSQNASGGKINKFNPTTGAFISTIYTYPVGEIPRGIAMLGNDLYINIRTSTGGRVDKFTNATGTPSVFLTMDAGSNPYAGIVWGPDGRLYIADYGESEVQIYNSNGSLYRVITTSLSGSHGVAFTGCSALNVSGIATSSECLQGIDLNISGGIKLNIVNSSNQPYKIQWSTGDTTESITGLSPGNYYVTVTDWNQVFTIDTFVITAPTCACFANPSPPQTLCAGGTGTNLTIKTTSNATNSVKFVRFISDQMSGSSPTAAEAAAIYAGMVIGSPVTPTGASSLYTATYTFDPADFPNTGTTVLTYYVYAILNPDVGASCRPVLEIPITINPVASISAQPTNITECIGGTASLSVSATGGTAPLSYQWQNGGLLGFSWSNIAGATSATYTPLSTSSGITRYRVVISSSGTNCTTKTSSNAIVTIVPAPSVSVNTPPANVCVGANVTLNANPIVLTGSCSVQWQSSPDGTTWINISGATGNTYNVTNLSATTRYRAQLVSCTGNGCCN